MIENNNFKQSRLASMWQERVAHLKQNPQNLLCKNHFCQNF